MESTTNTAVGSDHRLRRPNPAIMSAFRRRSRRGVDRTCGSYPVATILAHSDGFDDVKMRYRIKWEGYPEATSDTWEPEGHLANARDFLKDYWDSIGGKPSSSFSSSSSSVPPPQAKRGRGKPPSISRNKDGLIFPGLADRTTPPRSNGSSDATGGKGQRDQAAAGAMPQAGRDKTDEGFGVAE